MPAAAALLRLTAAVAIGCLLLLWAGWYARFPESVHLKPEAGATVATAQPLIVAGTHAAVPATQLRRWRLWLDGREVTGDVVSRHQTIAYRPAQPLEPGRHRVAAELVYRGLIPRTVAKSAVVAVDTTPPGLELSARDGILATTESRAILEGRSEPGSQVTISDPSEPLKHATAAPDGTFALRLGAGKARTLVVQSADAAGNVSTARVVVVRDRAPPVLAAFSPAAGAVLSASRVRLGAEFAPDASGLKTVVLWVDGKQPAGQKRTGNRIDVLSGPLPDGPHMVRVEAVDGVGLRAVEKRTFTIETTKLVIRRDARRLHHFRGGKLIRSYPVAVGQSRYPTPRGEFRIVAKRRHPTWVNPNKQWSERMPARIPPGRGNPLGTRALNLSIGGIRIHGTYISGSIGRAVSHGCIRMHIRDVEELYERVKVGTRVTVTD